MSGPSTSYLNEGHLHWWAAALAVAQPLAGGAFMGPLVSGPSSGVHLKLHTEAVAVALTLVL